MIAPRLRRLGLAALLACGASSALAIEFRSVAEPAIMYDGPSDKSKRQYIIAAGTPVEIVVALDNKWVKVREPGTAIAWVERRALAAKRTVMVTAARTVIRQQAAETAPPAFEAVHNVTLELVEPPADGWIKVRHNDGATGYARANDFWGL